MPTRLFSIVLAVTAPFSSACQDSARECDRFADTVADEALASPLMKVFLVDEAAKTTFRQTYKEELCKCVVPKLEGTSLKALLEEDEAAVSACARSAGEIAGRLASGGAAEAEATAPKVAFCGEEHAADARRLSCSDPVSDL